VRRRQPNTDLLCIYAVAKAIVLGRSRVARGTDHAHILQTPLNETLREDIASGYVSYEYSTVPGTVVDPDRGLNPGCEGALKQSHVPSPEAPGDAQRLACGCSHMLDLEKERVPEHSYTTAAVTCTCTLRSSAR